MPDEAAVYAVPEEWRDARGRAPPRLPRPLGGVGRAAGRAAMLAATAGDLRLVVCHLGGGASATAVRGRALGGHQHGLQPPRGAGDGDPVGIARPRRAPAPDPARRDRPRRRCGGCSTRRAAWRPWRARPTCARWRRARRRRRRAPRAGRWPCTTTAWPATVAAMTAALGGLDAVVFTGGRGGGLGARPRRGRPAPRLPRAGGRPGAQRRRPRATPTSRPDGAAVRTLVVHAREERRDRPRARGAPLPPREVAA